jgi:hypothetical protein
MLNNIKRQQQTICLLQSILLLILFNRKEFISILGL